MADVTVTAEELATELIERGLSAMLVLEAGAQMLMQQDPAAAAQMAALAGGLGGAQGWEVGA